MPALIALDGGERVDLRVEALEVDHRSIHHEEQRRPRAAIGRTVGVDEARQAGECRIGQRRRPQSRDPHGSLSGRVCSEEAPPERAGPPRVRTASVADHAVDALAACGDIKLSAAFGPQHGLRGDKQDNMIESPDFIDPAHRVPVFSLYGEVRRPKDEWMETFDVVLIDQMSRGELLRNFRITMDQYRRTIVLRREHVYTVVY